MAGQSINIRFYGQGLARKSVLDVEPRWWDAEDLCADAQFTKSHDSGSHFDWDAHLTVEEFIRLHERFRPRATSGVYARHDWQEIIRPRIQAIDGALAGTLGKISKINVRVAER
jgi:hypothetical protein